MAKRIFQDKLNVKDGNVDLELTLIVFEEDGSTILYSPSLNLSGFGDNEGEALNAFNDAMYLYLEYVVNEKTLEKDLKKLGWSRSEYRKKRFRTSKYSPKEIMSEKGIFNFGVFGVNKELALQA